MSNPFGVMPVGGAGWRHAIKHAAWLIPRRIIPSKSALLLVSVRWTQSLSVFRNVTNSSQLIKVSLLTGIKFLGWVTDISSCHFYSLRRGKSRVCWCTKSCLSAWSIPPSSGSQTRAQDFKWACGISKWACKPRGSLAFEMGPAASNVLNVMLISERIWEVQSQECIFFVVSISCISLSLFLYTCPCFLSPDANKLDYHSLWIPSLERAALEAEMKAKSEGYDRF